MLFRSWIAIGIAAWVYGVLAAICLILQWFYVLIFGRRHEGLSNFVKGYLEYLVHRMSYVYLMSDTRPRILPDEVRIYEEVVEKPG